MRPSDRLAAMAMFARVADTLSFTDAARELDLSKSALSKEIARLEVALGVGLLERTTRRVELTPVGRAYNSYCARLIHELEGADEFLREFHEEPFGNLRLTAPVTFGNREVQPAIATFLKAYGQVYVDLELTDRVVDVAAEDIDVAIVVSPGKPDGIGSTPLTPIRWGLYASPAYLREHATIRRPEDLAHHGFVSFRGNTTPPALSLVKGKRRLELKVRYLLRANNSTALMQATRQGIGIGYLPQYVTREALLDGSLRQLLPDWGSEQRTAYATFVEARYLSPRVRLFVEHLTAHFTTPAAAL